MNISCLVRGHQWSHGSCKVCNKQRQSRVFIRSGEGNLLQPLTSRERFDLAHPEEDEERDKRWAEELAAYKPEVVEQVVRSLQSFGTINHNWPPAAKHQLFMSVLGGLSYVLPVLVDPPEWRKTPYEKALVKDQLLRVAETSLGEATTLLNGFQDQLDSRGRYKLGVIRRTWDAIHNAVAAIDWKASPEISPKGDATFEEGG